MAFSGSLLPYPLRSACSVCKSLGPKGYSNKNKEDTLTC